MTNYLAPISREQFNKFYRYGYTFIPNSQTILFDGKITSSTKDAVVDLFTCMTPFEYDEDYLILHFEQSDSQGAIIRFNIQDVIGIYPLSQQAKASIEGKLDQRIKIEQPVFENALEKIESNIQKEEILKAIEALWLICNPGGNPTDFIEAIGFENISTGLEFRKSGANASKISGANYWSYLLAYDRFDYFPNSTLGYFYDAGQVFAYSKGLPTFEGSGLYKFLEALNIDNPDIKFKDVIKHLENNEQVIGYIQQTTNGTVKQYFIAPIYLMLKDELRNSDEVAQTKLLKHTKYLLDFGDNFKAAIVLLGAFFGFKRFYDEYYNRLNLRFYKPIKQVPSSLKGGGEELIDLKVLPKDDQYEKEKANSVSGLVINKDLSSDQLLEDLLLLLKEKDEWTISNLVKEFNKRTGKSLTVTNISTMLLNLGPNVELVYRKKKIDKARIITSSATSEPLQKSDATLFDS